MSSHVTQQSLFVLAGFASGVCVGDAQPHQTQENVLHRAVILGCLRVNRRTEVIVNCRLLTKALYRRHNTTTSVVLAWHSGSELCPISEVTLHWGPTSTWMGDHRQTFRESGPTRYVTSHWVNSAFYPPWNGKMSISFRAE